VQVGRVGQEGRGPREPARRGALFEDPDRPRRLAAVVAGYHASVAQGGVPLMLGWVRPARGGPATVFATASVAEPAGGLATLSFPPGCRGRRYPVGEAAAVLASLPSWTLRVPKTTSVQVTPHVRIRGGRRRDHHADGC
jgi:hypothetical protein